MLNILHVKKGYILKKKSVLSSLNIHFASLVATVIKSSLARPFPFCISFFLKWWSKITGWGHMPRPSCVYFLLARIFPLSAWASFEFPWRVALLQPIAVQKFQGVNTKMVRPSTSGLQQMVYKYFASLTHVHCLKTEF